MPEEWHGRSVVSDLGYAVPGMVEKLPQQHFVLLCDRGILQHAQCGVFVKLLVLDNAIVVLLHALALAHSDLIAGWKSE